MLFMAVYIQELLYCSYVNYKQNNIDQCKQQIVPNGDVHCLTFIVYVELGQVKIQLEDVMV